MSVDPGGQLRHASTTGTDIHAVIARVVERELTRDRAARQKLARRRAAAERARRFEAAALEAVSRG